MTHLKNFAMMIPKFATHVYNGCFVHNATGKEWIKFVEYVQAELIQLTAETEKLDLWINKDPFGLGRTHQSLQRWFDQWKYPPKQNYSFTETIIK